MAIECKVSGVITNIVFSRDKLTKCLNIKCYDNSDYTCSVLKCPLNIDEAFHIGDEISLSVTPRAFLTNGKARVLYFFDTKDNDKIFDVLK